MRNLQYPRSLYPIIREDLGRYPVVAVMGARQVGKSTLGRAIAAELGFAVRTLDDSDVRRAASEDPEGFLAELGGQGAFIDEVQRAPELMLALKAVVDRDQRNGRYLLSGSNQSNVGKAVSDSLLGRAAYRTLRPLTLSELRFGLDHCGWSFLFAPNDEAVLGELTRRASASGELDWKEAVRMGGLPRVVAAAAEQRFRLLDDYVQVFSRRDARELIPVDAPDHLETFVRLAAARTGQELNASALARDLSIQVSTVRRWLDVLARSYLVEPIPPYFRNASKRVIKAPKLYCVDPALALAAARETEPTGFHLETLVANDLLVWRDAGVGRSLYHWRLASGQEVDFILEQERRLLPVEVKAARSVNSGDARHVRTFLESSERGARGILLSCDPTIRFLGHGILACPWWAVL